MTKDSNQRACQGCGATLPAGESITVLGQSIDIQATVCNACANEDRIRAEVNAKVMRMARFAELCPTIYRDTDVAHPGMNKAFLASVMAWQFGARGLVLYGETRTCKTRMMWLLLNRLYVDERRRFVAMTSGEFARGCGEAYGTSAEDGRIWFERLSRAPILFIDDFGKEKATERVESELFDIIEHRTSTGRPILLTTNGVGDTLRDKFTPDRGGPIIERIREFCTGINFGIKRKK